MSVHKPLTLALSLLLASAPLSAGAQAASKPVSTSASKSASSSASKSASKSAPKADPAMIAIRNQWRQVTEFIARSAEQMPEADYAYRPIATVRTFGQLVAHVAGAQASICASALGEKGGAEDAVEKGLMTKAAITTALTESSAICERAYAQGMREAAKPTTMFGESTTRIGAMALNAVHNGEHYGNIITYFRMKGMVPPSSQ